MESQSLVWPQKIDFRTLESDKEAVVEIMSYMCYGGIHCQDLLEDHRVRQLTSLSLDYCTFNGNLSFLAHFAQLERLEIKNAITQENTVFGHTAGLTSLSGLENCPRLQTITIRTAPDLTDLSGIEFCSELYYVDIQNSGLTDISLLQNLPIRHLNISVNKVSHIPEGMNCLTHLRCSRNKKIDMSAIKDSPITHLTCEECDLENLDFLEGNTIVLLNCSRNNLTRLPSLPRIEELFCKHNQLTSEGISIALDSSSQLNELRCSSNRLTDIEFLRNQHRLLSLVIDRNQIDSLEPLKDLQFINHVSAADNRITKVPLLKSTAEMLEISVFDNPGLVTEDLRTLCRTRREQGLLTDVVY